MNCYDDEDALTLDQANLVLERAYANDDTILADAAERVCQWLSGMDGVALVGDVIMVSEAR